VGDTVHLKDYRGKTVLLNLWATWCRPCLTEIPYLQRLHEEFADQGLVVVGVSVDAALHRDAVIEFVEKMGVTYDILLDPETRSEKIFLARGLPNSVLIDRKGVVAFSWLGEIQEDDPTFLRGLHDALGIEN